MKTQSALINPVKLPDDLNEAENIFVQCIAAGKPCIFGTTRPKPDDKNAPVIRAEVIRFFAYGGSQEHPISGNIIHLEGAYVNSLSLAHAQIPYALRFVKCFFDGETDMSYAECRYLNMCGSRCRVFNGNYLIVENEMFMNGEFAATGGVWLSGAKIGGDFWCGGGSFINSDGYALVAEDISIKGNCHMTLGFAADGEVLMVGARIGGDWVCSNCTFKNKNGYALAADRAKVEGNVNLWHNFSAEGMVWLPAITVGGRLHCTEATFRGGLNLEGAGVKNTLIWKSTKGSGLVNLSYACVDTFADDEKSRERFSYDLEGFSYSRFVDYGGYQSRINWLKNRPHGHAFSPQPLEQAAKVLFAMGHDIDAREILLEKEKMLTAHGSMSGELRAGRLLWGVFAGYGYRLRKTLAWSVGVILAGAVVFDFADDACHIVPSQPAVVVSEKYMNAQTHKCAIKGEPTKATVRLFPEYSEFQPLAYSVDVFFPFFALHQEPYWEPKPGGETNEVVLYALRFLFWLEVALGWLLTSLAVLSVAGLLRPRQSSGDKE